MPKVRTTDIPMKVSWVTSFPEDLPARNSVTVHLIVDEAEAEINGLSPSGLSRDRRYPGDHVFKPPAVHRTPRWRASPSWVPAAPR